MGRTGGPTLLVHYLVQTHTNNLSPLTVTKYVRYIVSLQLIFNACFIRLYILIHLHSSKYFASSSCEAAIKIVQPT
jgi:hypothetical protein